MDNILEASVNSRKNALVQACTNPSLMDEINEYFERVEEFAKGCSDVADFEAKFNSSLLMRRPSHEYLSCRRRRTRARHY